MKKGDIVTIYQDPITQQQREGRAKLRKRIKTDGDMELWEVKFINFPDDPTVSRWIIEG